MAEQDYTFANLESLRYIEELYEQFLRDPNSIDTSWKHFFQGMGFASLLPQKGGSPEVKSLEVIELYRNFGHLEADFMPVRHHDLKAAEQLKITDRDLNAHVSTFGVMAQERAPLKELIANLRRIYCGTVGYECHLPEYPEIEKWIYSQIEPNFKSQITNEKRFKMYEDLYSAVHLEAFADKRYPGQVRFSLQGGEALVPMMGEMFDIAAEKGVNSVAFAMSHRGRVNVLANVLKKPYVEVLEWFHPDYIPPVNEGRGDLKYHKGFDTQIKTYSGRDLHINLIENPSHLETIFPVLEGVAKARQNREGGAEKILPIVMHGDSAFAGQGVVYEGMQMARVEGFSTGGTIHIIVNNNIGYTTAPENYKSTTYCTDIAKAFSAPVFHVNSEDPETCLLVGRLAIEIRQRFGIDVIIDFNCYRRKGHNEADEPRFTSPKYYEKSDVIPSIEITYKNQLISSGAFREDQLKEVEARIEQEIEKAYQDSQSLPNAPDNPMAGKAKRSKDVFSPQDTTFDRSKLLEMGKSLNTLPESVTAHKRLQRILNDRVKSLEEGVIDWAIGEQLGFATLVSEGHPVRLTGQDSCRGTFSHRHAAIVDQNSGERYIPIQTLGHFEIYDAILNEFATIGFEFGYSRVQLDGIVCWEAQFGDFCNMGQTVIDQYIGASEQKWGAQTSLVMILPHGMEGVGPEHSQAYLGRFLLLCADHNMVVSIPTTPAQYFHLLRKAAKRDYKVPHIIFSPKAPLRYKPSYSSLDELATGTFQEVIDDPSPASEVKRLLFCSGKVYYDLIDRRGESHDTAIIRIEQLYPLHEEKLKAVIDRYTGISEAIWVQEEHLNWGAYEGISPQIQKLLPQNIQLQYVGRDRSSSPASGSPTIHKSELQEFLNQLFPG
ncbi:MAG: 2-oxoglutarate dehydrogenase E1 component [Simkaniaceae bacterium]|nr:2-oxoglutarate dehydrogenase E1 component [Simkaniaceae bacterium]